MEATGLPPGWEVRHSNSKNLPYYFNPQTKESKWEPPPETDSETLKHYMGRYHTANQHQNGAAPAQPDLDGKIRCAHLLVKHKDSRRPSSWREANITRSKDEAFSIIKNYESRIKNGSTSLGELATTESDDPSARKRGDLGFFGQGDMQKEFEEASFVLKPGEISPVIETASGLHIIESLPHRLRRCADDSKPDAQPVYKEYAEPKDNTAPLPNPDAMDDPNIHLEIPEGYDLGQFRDLLRSNINDWSWNLFSSKPRMKKSPQERVYSDDQRERLFQEDKKEQEKASRPADDAGKSSPEKPTKSTSPEPDENDWIKTNGQEQPETNAQFKGFPSLTGWTIPKRTSPSSQSDS
ncbi:Uu.00g109290.m01.CDS01 [Anthostomella pinea]|uniref:peptidylprolyl isomerase n=1 Tax=Anthostomella pinea TaxID=933095 RepID=A0AAI8VER6_9PEZI|nr:Uu.00g109290.m01.CDS01 [Anthostomella pinea]